MTKPKNQAGSFPDVMGAAFSISDAGSRAQAFWKAQEAAVEHVRDYLDGWCERRRDAAASAADCCAHLMSNGSDLPAVSRAWTEWMSGAAERLREDVQAQTTFTTQIASDLAGGLALNGAKPHRRRSQAEPAAESDGGARARAASADIR